MGTESFSPDELHANKEHPPYRFDNSQMDALRMEAQSVAPELQTAYEDLEVYVGEKFLDIWGNYLHDDQKNYMTHPFLLLASRDNLPVLSDQFSNSDKIVDQDSNKVALNGKKYESYHIGYEMSDSVVLGEQYWAGRFAAVPPQGDYKVNKDTLMTREAFDATRVVTNDMREAFKAMKKRIADTHQWSATNTWAAKAIHEKTHGIQEYDIPLPMLEIDAYYREREIFKQNHWEERPMPPFEKAMDYWGELLHDENFGEDLQLFMFGNLKNEKREEEIREILRQKFTEEKMTELFSSSDVSERVVWETKELSPVATATVHDMV